MSTTLYRSHSLEKSGDTISGSMTLWEDAPVSPFDVGDSFRPVENGPALTVDKVSIKDNVIGELNGKTLRQWEITIEGSNSPSENTAAHISYSFSIEEAEGYDIHSGSMTVINEGNAPALSINTGERFFIPGIGTVLCSKVSGNDDFSDNGTHVWTVTYEGSDKVLSEHEHSEDNVQYSLTIEKNSDGVTVYSGSMEITSTGTQPSISVNVGDTFSLPLVGSLTCTRVHSSNLDTGTWSAVIEGSRRSNDHGSGQYDALPDTETAITYEINGSTVRSVSGEFIALKRSETPITKKTITLYTKDFSAVATPGCEYEGGIATSENIIKETIKDNGTVISSYYKHTIEVEA